MTTRPIILGAGISGLSISRALARAGLEHDLIGPAPLPGLRPGESLDLAGTVAALDMFKGLERFFRPKRAVTFTLGRQIAHVPVRVTERRATRSLLAAMGLDAPDELLHIDRSGFDVALHAEVVDHPCCHWNATSVERLEADGDRVVRVVLRDGSCVEPSFVFDASGPAALMSRALDLPRVVEGRKQRLVMGHVEMPQDAGRWSEATTLHRLSRGLHGLMAGVWCIPLAPRVSVGITAPAEEATAWSDRELFEGAVAGLDEIGIPLRVGETPMLGGTFDYARTTRPRGENWLQVGPAHRLIWWPSGAALGSILLCAWLAPEFVKGSSRADALHQRYDALLSSTHRQMDAMMDWADPDFDGQALRRAVAPLVRGNMARAAVMAQVGGGWAQNTVAGLVERVVGGRSVGGVRCHVSPLGPVEPVFEPRSAGA